MVRRFSYVTAEEAFQRVIDTIDLHALESEMVPLHKAYSRILAEDIQSQTNLPPRDMSHFDGYAIKAMETKDASIRNPIYLTVMGELYPGQTPSYEVRQGTASYITTGSFLPEGTDAVIAVEATKLMNTNQIEVRSKIDPYDHVIPCGSDVKKGQILFRKGHQLRAQDLNLLATLRIRTIKVVRKPKVSFLCVGDELTDNMDEIATGKIVNSHRYTLSTLIDESGGRPVYLGIVSDQVAEIAAKIREGISKADILLVIGGSSMGAKDVTSQAIDSAGKPGIILHGLKRKPGRVTGFGVVGDNPVIILPGLCHSLIVGFYTLARPLIQVMSGFTSVNTQLVLRAKLIQPISYTSFIPFEHVTFVNVIRTREGYQADPCRGESSSFSALVRANAFIITPPGKVTVKIGEEVEVHLLPGFCSLRDFFTTIP